MFADSDIQLDFERTARRTRELPLIPLIDIAFILIIFFMLTTSFMKIESMELLIPAQASAKKTPVDTSLAHIFLSNDGKIAFGQRVVDGPEMNQVLTALFQRNPDQRIIIMAANKVSLQEMVEMMDAVYAAGGKSVYVKAWEEPLGRPGGA